MEAANLVSLSFLDENNIFEGIHQKRSSFLVISFLPFDSLADAPEK